MDEYKKILGRYFNPDKSCKKKEKEFIVQATNLYVAYCIENGCADIGEIYKSFPYAYMFSCESDFIHTLTENSSDFAIVNHIVRPVCRWFKDYISEYVPCNEAEKIIIDNRLNASARDYLTLNKTGELCHLTGESVRQCERNIQTKVLSFNFARREFPHLFIKDHYYMKLFEEFQFSYESIYYLENISPLFASAERYYKFISGKSVLKLSSGCVNKNADAFSKCVDYLKDFDPNFKCTIYGFFKTKSLTEDKSVYAPLTAQNVIIDLLKCCDEPITMKSLYLEYVDRVRELELGPLYDRTESYFEWNMSLIKNVLRTSGKKVRYYDYEKHSRNFKKVFDYLERLLRKEYVKCGEQKFLIRDIWNRSLSEKLLTIDIHNEEELHSLLKHFYKNKKIVLGRIPAIKEVKA